MKMTTWIAACMAAVTLAAGAPALSETQTENIVAEQRLSVSVRISAEAAQAFLPTGWVPANPTLSVIFMDRTLQLTPAGAPLNSGVNELLVLVLPARNAATGETRSMVVGGYSSDPGGAPGAYGVYRSGAVSLTRTERKEVRDGRIAAQVQESWVARGDDGNLTLEIDYERGVPNLGALDIKVYSGANPDFYRMYRGQQATDVLRGQGVDRVKSIRITASGGRLGRAIDGSQQIVSVSSAPFYSRLTFVP